MKTKAPAPPGYKHCGGCSELHPVAAFGRNRARPDGLQDWCKAQMTAAVKRSKALGKLMRNPMQGATPP